jgi:hypothetical protein
VFEEVQLGFLIVDHTHEDMMAILDIFPKNWRTKIITFWFI